MTQPYLSVVVPTYRSSHFITQTLDALAAWAKTRSDEVEVVMVDDGSSDDTFSTIRNWTANSELEVRIVELFRNTGQFHALMAGLSHARGELVVTFDDDLEYAPTEIEKLIAPFETQPGRHDVVIGVAQERDRTLLRNWGSAVVNRVNTVMFNKPLHLRSSSFRAMTGEFARNLTDYKTSNPVMGPLIFKASRRIINLPVEHQAGLRQSNYSYFGLIRTFYANILNFSEFPLQYISRAGLILAMASLTFAAFILMQYITGWPYPIKAPGWTSLTVAIAFFSGAILFSIGFLGQYVFRIIEEVNKTPNYQVRRFYTGEEQANLTLLETSASSKLTIKESTVE